MTDADLATTLAAATWVPKVTRDGAARRLPTATPSSRELLAFALSTRHAEAVSFWVTLDRQHLPRDVHRRLTPALLRHLVTVAGARTERPARLLHALTAIAAAASPQAVEAAQAAALLLGRGVSLAQAHGLYVAAARAAPAAALPSAPPHLGGPTPELSVFETVQLAIDLATVASHKQPHPESAALVSRAVKVLGLARAGLAAKVSRPERAIPPTSTSKGPTWTLARAALKEAWTTDHVSGRGTSIKSAVVTGLSLGEPAWWLEQVDEALMRADARTAWERRGQATSSPLVHCVWRGGDARSKFWLCRLESSHFALLSKLGRVWRSTEGDFDSVLATLPDDWFARALPVAQARR
ncbi:MAG: hypothetical protein MUC96_01660 [Myxococcaceae bacterium]|nr:hypothetical protein [Myxococcaceae bacterium]